MSDLNKPHALFFKELLSRPEVAADFLANYLPTELVAALDLSAPELVKDSFADEELRQHFSDLLYRARLKRGGEVGICVLFEHKSAPEALVAFQVLRYEVRFWESELRQGVDKLSPVIPLVFYHGRAKWNVARNFSALMAGNDMAALRKYAPEFEYHLCDLSAYSEDEIKGQALVRLWLLLLKNIFSDDLGERLGEIFKLLSQLPKQTALEYLRTVLRYLSAAAQPPTVMELRDALAVVFPKQEGGLMQSFSETWLEEGRQEGRQEGVALLMLRQLRRRFGILDAGVQARIRELPVERLEQLGEDLLDFVAREEVVAWLQAHTEGKPQ